MTSEELKNLMNSSDFYDRFDKNKHWDFLGVMSGRAMQSAEFNEIQHILEEKVKALGNALYADGTIIEGCAISFDPEAKTANLDAGRVFLDGLVYEVDAASLSVPDTASVQIGIWKKSKRVTEYEDDSLFDPAKGTPQYHMPGGYRVVTTAEWGLSTDHADMPFFPVYGISDAEIVTQLQEKVSPEYLESLARYDNHANGHYVVEGLRVTALESIEKGKQTYSISEGTAHVNGYEAVISHSVRLVTDEAPDLADIKSEVHVFNANTGGSAVISVSHTPIEQIKQILITKERTVNLTHGGYTGCTDELPDTSVFEIMEVKQGALVFTQGTDFHFASDRLSWNLPGEEPAPFSTYTVTYHYRVSVRAVKGTTDKKNGTEEDTISYSFLDMSTLVDTYEAAEGDSEKILEISGYKIKVKISKAANNAIVVREDGLHVDISGKTDKVVPTTAGNVSSLDASGNLTDSGVAAENILQKSNIATEAEITEMLNEVFGTSASNG